MKQFAKRGVSLLLVLVLLVSLLPGLPLQTSAATYPKNWGYREQVATSFANSTAPAFYAANRTSYEQLASFAGSASLSSVPNSPLYKQLQSLMKNAQTHETSYGETRDLFPYTDCEGGGKRISSFYSGVLVGPDWDAGATWNREHTWPNSKGDASGNGENDIMMLRPTAKSENGSRSNKAYGRSSNYYDPNMESGGKHNLHGDVARIMLYVYVRWGNSERMWGSSGVMESKEVLLDWMEEDPVDTWELGRNDVTQTIVGTRNVFVDYPELAFLMFGEEIPSDMVTPSGMAQTGAYDIAVSSNNTAMGTVSRSGNKIQAVPAAGYKVVGYEVVRGSAVVTQNGNVFQVKASSDCEIRILFAAKTVVKLTYLNNGAVLSSADVYDGEAATLSAYTGVAPVNYTFLGWVDAPVANTVTMPTYYRAGESYLVSGGANLYALFSCTALGEEGTSTFYTTSTCAHGATVDKAGQDADCINSGYTAGVYCNDCDSYISGHTTITAYGHSYSSEVTEPTVTEPGYTTHTCSRCGDVYTSDPVPALGETYTVSFSVPMDVAAVESMGCNTKGIELPEAAELEGYSFQGWTTEATSDTMQKPLVLQAGDKYVATANTTLYALYTYTVGGTGAGGYVLVTDADQLEVGTNVVIASADYDLAMSTTQNSNNRGQAPITKSGTGITFDASAGVAVLELREGAVAGTYAFYCPIKSGYLYAASSSGNQLKTKSALDANGSFAITVEANGVATVKAQGTSSRNWMRYNKSSSLFACYGSGQNDIALYVEAPAGDTYYTTEIAHRHSVTYRSAQAATCQAPGNVEYWFCHCGMAFADSDCTEILYNVTLPKLDHTFTKEVAEEAYLKAEATCAQAAQYARSCENCGAASEEEVFSYGEKNPENHTGEENTGEGQDATCEADGMTGAVTCGGCGVVLVPGKVIPGGHTVENGICTRCKVYGTCGENLTWALTSDGTLTVSGTGAMYDYSTANASPWSEKVEDITAVVLENGVTSIGDYAFHGCRDLLQITLSSFLESIGSYAFYSCNALAEITIPASVVSVKSRAFAWCTSLTEVTFANDAPQIASNAFHYVTATAYYPAGNITWMEEKRQSYGGTITWVGDCTNGHAEVIDEAVEATCTSDGKTEGKHCSACGEVLVTQKVIPGGHTVENGICTRCKVYGTCGENLTWTYEDGTLTISGEGEMYDYNLDVGIRPWENYIESITQIIIKERVTSIGKQGFYGCSNLVNVNISNSVTSLGNYAFYHCDNLRTVEIPDSVRSVGSNTFAYCTSLINITLPDSVTALGESAFYGCANLRSIEIPKSVTVIEDHTFFECMSLANVIIPESVVSIGETAFYRCYDLHSVKIPGSIVSIGDFAFQNSALTEIYFEGDAPNFGQKVFKGVTATAYYSPDATWVAEGVKQNYGGTITWVARGSGTCGENLTWTYGDGTLTISGEGEMYDYSTEANPENAPWAYYLEEVESIVIEEGVTSVGHQAFSGLFAVTEVSLPDTLTTIGDSAFFNCVALEEIVIPANVTSIGDSAFTFCYALKEITFNGSAPAIGREAFGLVNANVHYTPDFTWNPDALQNYGGTITWVPSVTYVAEINGVGYETFDEALAAAAAGDEIKLLENVDGCGYLVIPNGVTLNLGDCTLSAEYIFASKDSFVVGNPDSGKLLVSKGNLLLGQNGYTNEQGQYILPVWDPAEGGYIFSLFVVNTDTSKGRGLTIEEEAQRIFFQFKHQATAAINDRLLSDGSSDNELSVIIRLSWTNEQGTAYQDFVYNDAQVGKVTGKFDYTFTLTGYTALNINLATLEVTAMVVTESGATAFGQTWLQNGVR